jgi:phospholipase/carboxylesterase
VIDKIDELLAPLLLTLERMMWVQRHLHPQLADQLADQLAPVAEGVKEPLRGLEEATWPESLGFMRERLLDVGRRTLDMVHGFVEAARESGDPIDLYRAVRRFARVQETLYPLAPAFDPVSRWFLDPPLRQDDDLVARLRTGALRGDEVHVGVMHADNERESRGGFSLYVPEAWDGHASMPLVVALHGGSGHGRDFLWSWLREARGRNVLVLSPTAQGRTWSIMGGGDIDADGLRQAVDSVAGRYPVDRSRVLLTGMSDGATYALLLGLGGGPPFTHLAPACGVLHPMLFAGGFERARDVPIYLIHGALDWMFPVQIARMGRDALLAAGARVVYREIEDLSHTYPRDENPRILEWLMEPMPT